MDTIHTESEQRMCQKNNVGNLEENVTILLILCPIKELINHVDGGI